MKRVLKASVLWVSGMVLLHAFGLAAGAQTASEPSWPQQFQVLEGESASFGFFVTQPGAITVQVVSQGAPVLVSLSGPAVQPIQQTGSGALRLSYNATAADVQKSSIWVVRITSANVMPAPLNRLPNAVASGSVTVTHPPANTQVAQAELQQKATASKSAPVPAKLAAASLATLKAKYAKQVSDQQAAQLQVLKSSLAKPVQLATAPGIVRPVGVAATVGKTTTTTSAGTGTGVSQVGSTGNIQTVATPTITSLSVAQGQPGDPVRIDGSSFGATPGKVHFIVASGKDLVPTTVDYWSDSQIVTVVPDISGILGYAGQVYVEHAAGQKSGVVSFHFIPTTDFIQISPTIDDGDATVDKSDLDYQKSRERADVTRNGDSDVWGHKADDLFFKSFTLKNGWVVDSVSMGEVWADGNGSASVVDSRIGSSSPYVKVHWWMDAFTYLMYKPVVTIKGPKGVPYQ